MRMRNFSRGLLTKKTDTQIIQPYSYEATSSGSLPKPGPRSGPRWPLWLGLVVVGLLVVAVVTTFVINASLDSQYAGKIEPGVSISGVYVGKMSRDDAKTVLEKQLQSYEQKPVVLSFQDKNWTPNLAELGIAVNVDASLDKAAAFGHTSDLIDGSRIFKLMNPQTANFPLEIQLNDNKLKSYLDTVATSVHQDVVEPKLELKDGQLLVTAGKTGYNVDYAKTLTALRESLVKLEPVSQNLLQVTTVNPTTTNAEISSLKDKINAITSQPVTVKFNDKTWTLDQKTLVGLITLSPNNDAASTSHFDFSVNRDYIKNFVAALSKGIDQDPQDGKLGWNGHLVAAQQSKDGQKLDVDKSVEAVMQSINDPTNRTANLVVNVTKPAIDTSNLDAFGVKDLIGEGVSHFGGSLVARGHNIETAASYLTGAFIKPHSTFSFLDTIGEISEKRGYWKGYSIVADQTVPDVGGGVCQVSTTTFRAAFFAGLPIEERHEHAYRVHWYEEMGEPVGFDAAVYQPGSDFKFDNPYDNWLYLQAYTSNGYLHVKLYGTKVPGQTVELKASGPYNFLPAKPDKIQIVSDLPPGVKKQVDYAQQGVSADITRIIKVNGVVVKTSTFPSRYEAWSNIYQVGAQPAPKPVPAPTNPPSPAQPQPAATTTTVAAPNKTTSTSTQAPASTPTPSPAPATH